jgi:hypothetical protein
MWLVIIKLQFMVEETTWRGKGVTTNRNELGVELDLKNSKVQSGEIEMVVCANKVTCP